MSQAAKVNRACGSPSEGMQMEDLLSVKAEMEAVVDEAQDSLPQARYNTGLLKFLCQRMTALRSLHPAVLTRVLENSSQEYLVSVKDAAVQASTLVKGHTMPFQIGTYYKVDYVQDKVRQFCKITDACLPELGMKAVGGEIETEIAAACEKDMEYMHWYLTCILEGSYAGADLKLSEGELQDLKELINSQRVRMEFVNRIQEEDIEAAENIGEGGFGKVVKARWNGMDVAVKKMMKELSPEAQAEFYHEVELHILLNHPHVVRCYGAISSSAIVMELALTDLEQLCWRSDWTWGQKVQLMLDACKGLAHLHKSGVVHRDIKTSNFLVFESQTENKYVVKICDFGLSVAKAETRSKTRRPRQGTRLWMAPEVIRGTPHSFESDMFSFGLVLFVLATVSPPYRGITEPAADLKKEAGKDPCVIPEDCPEPLTELMRRCISPASSQRLTIAEARNRLEGIVKCYNPEMDTAWQQASYQEVGTSGAARAKKRPRSASPTEMGDQVEERGKVLRTKLSRVVTTKFCKEVRGPSVAVHIPTQVDAIGQKQDVAMVKKMLLSGNTIYVAVVGMGGVGKTTLARCVIHDEDVKERFRKNDEEGCLGVGFVTISRYPDILDRLKRIWECFFGEKVEFASVEEGKWKLEANLHDKTFFLVMDDVWDETDMVGLDVAPPNSRVLVTSRNNKVAHVVAAECYDVTPLDNEASHQLFCKQAFDDGMAQKWQERFIPAIIRKCDGLPLALEIMGREARSFKERQQWRDAVEIMTETEVLKNQVFDHVFGLSFNRMHSVHQEVLLDMAMLPEDYQARATDMAELQLSIGLCASERIAREALRTLEDKALLREKGYDVSEVPEFQRSCLGVRYYLHDVVRESALHTIAKKSVLERERLVSSHLRQGTYRGQALMATRFSTSQRISIDQAWALQELEMPELKVLMLRDAGISELPPSIFTARLLAVDLTSSGIAELPSEISCLQSAELLRLGYCNKLVRLPSEVGGMSQLRVLSMRECKSIYEIPESLGNLLLLTKLLIPECGIACLCGPDMKMWRNLTMLDLSKCTGLKQLPSNIGELVSLTALNLGGCMQCACLPDSIGQLGQLEVLILHRCNSLTGLPDTLANLANMQELDVQECPRLAGIPNTIGRGWSMLRILRLQGNSHMTFPEFFEDLECLEVLGLDEECAIPDAFKRRLEDQKIKLETSVTELCEDCWNDYIPLHWGAQNGMDDMVKFHLSETNVELEGWVGAGEPHSCTMTTSDTYFAQNSVLQAVGASYRNATNDCMQPSWL